MNRTVITMLNDAVEQFGDQPYCYKKTDPGWTSLSFGEVRDQATAVARALMARGIEAGAHLSILAEGSPQWVVFELGVLSAGCASVPLSIKLLAEELPFRINHSQSVAIGLSVNQAAKIGAIYGQFESAPLLVVLDPHESAAVEVETAIPGVSVVRLDALIEEGRALKTELPIVQENTTATISYTSGTTGNPKGIMLTHLNYYSNSHDSIELFQVPYGYSTLLILPCDHSFAHTVGIYAALVRGIRLYFVDARGGGMAILRNIPGNILESNPTFLLTVPSLSGNFMKKIIAGVEAKGAFATRIFRRGLRAAIRRNGDGHTPAGLIVRLATWIPWIVAELLVFRKIRRIFGSRIEFFVGGGALLDRGQQEFFLAIGLPVYQGYGLTEAAPVISSNSPHRFKLGTSGAIAPSVTCRILREDGSEAPSGEKGEICVRGENVMAGYFQNPKATEEALRGGWLHTGDLGYFDEDGFLVVTGREKALLIGPDGEKYSPEEIEETITSSSELIHQIVAWNDHRNSTVAVITLDTERIAEHISRHGLTTADAVLDAIATSMYSYRDRGITFPERWTPARFVIAPEPFTEANGLVNSTMKIVRGKVTERYAADIDYLYGDEGGSIHNPRNQDQIRAMFDLTE